jgi:hypothetical protein
MKLMPRFSLRTLIVVMMLVGPMLAGSYRVWELLTGRAMARIHVLQVPEELAFAVFILLALPASIAVATYSDHRIGKQQP